MNPSPRLVVRPFAEADAEGVASLLASSRAEYTRFFDPFAFEADAIRQLLAGARIDQWFVLEIDEGGRGRPVGFYMLRGLDEGFPDPMYGVFVAEEFSGRGLARLTLAHAEAQCRLHGWMRLLLKVHTENVRAFEIYKAAGFEFERVDPKNEKQVVLCRDLGKP